MDIHPFRIATAGLGVIVVVTTAWQLWTTPTDAQHPTERRWMRRLMLAVVLLFGGLLGSIGAYALSSYWRPAQWLLIPGMAVTMGGALLGGVSGAMRVWAHYSPPTAKRDV